MVLRSMQEGRIGMDKQLQDIRGEIALSLERARAALEELKRRLNHDTDANPNVDFAESRDQKLSRSLELTHE
jgi:hypothetical protein